MKKLCALLLAFVIMLSMVACGGNNDTPPDNNTTGSQGESANNQTENNTTEDTKKPDDNKIKFSYSFKVPGKNIVIDVPDYQEMEKGFTQLYILHGVKYVAVTAAKNSTATELSAAHEDAFAKFKENIQNYSYVNSLAITKDGTETINGIQVYKYEGTLNCGKDTVYDAYVIGYSFVMDGVPCTVTGSVIDQAQDKAMIEEMKATVEAMIQTLRSER